MHKPMTRRTMLQVGCALGTALVVPPLHACEFYASTLKVVRPWSRASAPGATTAIICMVFEEVTVDDRLIGVSTPVASTVQMGGVASGTAINFVIHRDTKTELTENGIHLRLLDLAHPLEMGREYPLTLTFARGGSVAADFDVDYAYFG